MERTLVLMPQAAPALMEAHLTVEDVAAMIDGTLPPRDRASVEAHLAVCAECRAELAEASTIVRTAPARSRPRVRWGVALAAAAAVIVFAVVPALRNVNSSSPVAEQRADTSGVHAVTLRLPAADGAVAADSLRFAWERVPGVSTYRLVVTDSAGAPVFDRATTDTALTPPTGALPTGARYFWYVDALRDDASSITSTQAGFSIRAR